LGVNSAWLLDPVARPQPGTGHHRGHVRADHDDQAMNMSTSGNPR